MEIHIETTYLPLIVGREDLPFGAQLIRKPRYTETSSSAVAILSFTSRVSAESIASWLFEKMEHIKNKQKFVLKINDKDVRQFDLASLTETIEREIAASA